MHTDQIHEPLEKAAQGDEAQGAQGLDIPGGNPLGMIDKRPGQEFGGQAGVLAQISTHRKGEGHLMEALGRTDIPQAKGASHRAKGFSEPQQRPGRPG